MPGQAQTSPETMPHQVTDRVLYVVMRQCQIYWRTHTASERLRLLSGHVRGKGRCPSQIFICRTCWNLQSTMQMSQVAVKYPKKVPGLNLSTSTYQQRHVTNSFVFWYASFLNVMHRVVGFWVFFSAVIIWKEHSLPTMKTLYELNSALYF